MGIWNQRLFDCARGIATLGRKRRFDSADLRPRDLPAAEAGDHLAYNTLK